METFFFYLYASWALLILRIAVGATFLAHGWPKIKNLKATQENFGNMGFKPGKLWGTIAAVLEFVGGIFLIAGFFTMLVALLFVGEFFVITIWQIRRGAKFYEGWEIDTLIFAIVIMLFAVGAGPYSLDRLLHFWL